MPFFEERNILHASIKVSRASHFSWGIIWGDNAEIPFCRFYKD